MLTSLDFENRIKKLAQLEEKAGRTECAERMLAMLSCAEHLRSFADYNTTIPLHGMLRHAVEQARIVYPPRKA